MFNNLHQCQEVNLPDTSKKYYECQGSSLSLDQSITNLQDVEIEILKKQIYYLSSKCLPETIDHLQDQVGTLNELKHNFEKIQYSDSQKIKNTISVIEQMQQDLLSKNLSHQDFKNENARILNALKSLNNTFDELQEAKQSFSKPPILQPQIVSEVKIPQLQRVSEVQETKQPPILQKKNDTPQTQITPPLLSQTPQDKNESLFQNPVVQQRANYLHEQYEDSPTDIYAEEREIFCQYFPSKELCQQFLLLNILNASNEDIIQWGEENNIQLSEELFHEIEKIRFFRELDKQSEHVSDHFSPSDLKIRSKAMQKLISSLKLADSSQETQKNIQNLLSINTQMNEELINNMRDPHNRYTIRTNNVLTNELRRKFLKNTPNREIIDDLANRLNQQYLRERAFGLVIESPLPRPPKPQVKKLTRPPKPQVKKLTRPPKPQGKRLPQALLNQLQSKPQERPRVPPEVLDQIESFKMDRKKLMKPREIKEPSHVPKFLDQVKSFSKDQLRKPREIKEPSQSQLTLLDQIRSMDRKKLRKPRIIKEPPKSQLSYLRDRLQKRHQSLNRSSKTLPTPTASREQWEIFEHSPIDDKTKEEEKNVCQYFSSEKLCREFLLLYFSDAPDEEITQWGKKNNVQLSEELFHKVESLRFIRENRKQNSNSHETKKNNNLSQSNVESRTEDAQELLSTIEFGGGSQQLLSKLSTTLQKNKAFVDRLTSPRKRHLIRTNTVLINELRKEFLKDKPNQKRIDDLVNRLNEQFDKEKDVGLIGAFDD